jgi:hypothetical protein
MQLSVDELIPILQVAIGPVILISGIGLLLLSMTNRYGRTIDRARQLAAELRKGDVHDRGRVVAQVKILLRRAHLVRRAIIQASLSLLLAAFLIIVLFLTALFELEDALLISALFTGCMVALIVSLITFIQDLNLSLLALRMDVGEFEED